MTFCYTFTPIFIIYIDYIMRKVVLTLVTLVFVSFAYAQDVTFDSFKRIESDKVLNLSADQIAKIKKLNREVGPKFKAILSEKQVQLWEEHYGSMDNRKGLRGIMKGDYDHRLDQLEANFEKEKEAIENSSLSKDAKKAKVKALKNKYKQEKERLKNERDTAIKSGVLEK